MFSFAHVLTVLGIKDKFCACVEANTIKYYVLRFNYEYILLQFVMKDVTLDFPYGKVNDININT